MERSSRVVLLFLLIFIIGLFLTFGIVVYGRSLAQDGEKQAAQEDVDSEYSCFHLQGEEIERLLVYETGNLKLNIKPDITRAGQWTLETKEFLPIDQKRLSRFVQEVSRLHFSAYYHSRTADLTAYGLDFPTFEVHILTKSGKSQVLKVGGRSSAAKEGEKRMYYALSSQQSSPLALLQGAGQLLGKRESDFYRDSVLPFPAEGLSDLQLVLYSPTSGKLQYNLNFRKKNLVDIVSLNASLLGGFEELDRSRREQWVLESPYNQLVNQALFSDFLSNLGYLRVMQFMSLEEASEVGVIWSQPIMQLSFQQRSQRLTLLIYKNNSGNYYGRYQDSAWVMRLPASFHFLLNINVQKMLGRHIVLQPIAELRSLHWGSEVFWQDSQGWTYNGRLLTAMEEQELEKWYRNLSNQSFEGMFIRSGVDSFLGDELLENQDLSFWLQDKMGFLREMRWTPLKNRENMGLLSINGQSTGFLYRLPTPPPLLKENVIE